MFVRDLWMSNKFFKGDLSRFFSIFRQKVWLPIKQTRKMIQRNREDFWIQHIEIDQERYFSLYKLLPNHFPATFALIGPQFPFKTYGPMICLSRLHFPLSHLSEILQGFFYHHKDKIQGVSEEVRDEKLFFHLNHFKRDFISTSHHTA